MNRENDAAPLTSRRISQYKLRELNERVFKVLVIIVYI